MFINLHSQWLACTCIQMRNHFIDRSTHTHTHPRYFLQLQYLKTMSQFLSIFSSLFLRYFQFSYFWFSIPSFHPYVRFIYFKFHISLSLFTLNLLLIYEFYFISILFWFSVNIYTDFSFFLIFVFCSTQLINGKDRCYLDILTDW